MRFPRQFIDQVMEANNLVDIISQHAQLKPTGSGLMGRCPFPDHQEKTASFSVSESKQLYHCFGCHKSGNVLTFVKTYYGLTFPEAVEWLARRASLPLPVVDSRQQSQDDQINEKRKLIKKANRLAADFYQENIAINKLPAHVAEIIFKRSLSKEIIKDFEIGYAPREWSQTADHLKQSQIPIEIAEAAKLIVARKDGKSGHFDMFRDRLIFPIHNTMGDVVAFGGRVVNPEDQPKYLNSPETPVFEKKKILYGLYQTARYIRSQDEALVVEGYMDTVSLYQAGIKNVCAVMSSSLSFEQAKLIQRMTKNVVMLLDGDQAGMDGAERSLPILLQADLFAKGLFLPEGLDPDDYVKKYGAEQLRTLISEAQDLLLVVLDRWMSQGYKAEPAEKVKMVDKLKPIFAYVRNAHLKDLYCEEIAKKLAVQVGWLKQALMSGQHEEASSQFARGPESYRSGERFQDSNANKAGLTLQNQKNLPLTELNPEDVISLKGASALEVAVMSLSIKSRANIALLSQENAIEDISHLGVKQILQEALLQYRQDPIRFDRLISLLVTSVDLPALLFFKEVEAKKSVGQIDAGSKQELEEKLLRDALRRLKELSLRKQLQGLQKELQVDASNDKLMKLMSLQKQLTDLSKS